MAESVPGWYKGKVIFMTGGTGFMGKVLLEKLLRSCPEISRVYLLSRAKKGLTSKMRIAEFAKIPVFGRLLSERPNAFEKISIVEGDITKEKMGISDEDRRRLCEEVNVIFHLGATVKLESGLKNSVCINTAGTLKVLDLAKEIKKLQAFVHVSTAYNHCELEVLEEKLYDPPYDPREIIRATSWMSEEQATAITPSLIKDFPNSYTFSKRLAEGLVEEFSECLPVTVVRPSIVIPSIYEPMPGWVDSFNGPMGLLCAAGKGIVMSMIGDKSKVIEGIPVDVAANAFIIAAWMRAKEPVSKGNVPVYNVSSAELFKMTWETVMEKSKEWFNVYPLEPGIWYPNGDFHINPYTHALIVFFLQLIPAYIIDLLLPFFGHKPFMMKLQEKIHAGTKVMCYFTLRDWCFKTEKSQGLLNYLNEEDKKTFFLLSKDYDINSYLESAVLGSRLYLLKEPMSSLPRARRAKKILYAIHITTKIAFYSSLVWMLCRLLGFVATLWT